MYLTTSNNKVSPPALLLMPPTTRYPPSPCCWCLQQQVAGRSIETKFFVISPISSIPFVSHTRINFGLFQALSVPFGFHKFLKVWGFRSFQNISALFGFYAPAIKTRFQALPNLISFIWNLYVQKQNEVLDHSKSYQSHVHFKRFPKKLNFGPFQTEPGPFRLHMYF